MKIFVEIKLTQNKFAIIDYEDYYRVNQFKWYAVCNIRSKTFYAKTNYKNKNAKNRENIYMHRFVMQLKKGDKKEIDHINRNGLDNRKENLKITDRIGNMSNIGCKSKFGIGIAYRPKRSKKNPYQVQIQINGKMKHIGMFPSQEKAEIARNKWIKENTNAAK